MTRSRPLKPGLVARQDSATLSEASMSTRASRANSFVDTQQAALDADSRASTPLKLGAHTEGRVDQIVAEAAKRADAQAHMLGEEYWTAWRQMKAEMLRTFHPQRQTSPESSCTSLRPITEAETSVGSLMGSSTISGRVDYDSSDDEDGLQGPELDIIVGPTKMAAHGSKLRDLSIPQGYGQPAVPLKSHRRCLAVSDALRLAAARAAAPLSFGSVVHAQTRQPLTRCRPCMFEQRPGRCRKSFLCDFCHLSHPSRQKVKAKPVKTCESGGVWSL
mmetsp:Transcript_10339/g.24900  ORF Transcript_10339/g.24900 Transcript_10339/m.24900 type:complete len:275 (+) Transcript_10339:70-894(+)